MLIARMLVAALLACPLWALGGGQCTAQQSRVTALQSRIKADQNRIRQLNPDLTANELDSWANAAEEERHQILVKSIESGLSTLADGLLSAPKNALQPMDIAGYHLPNGIGSLGAGQANAIIGRLEAQGVSSSTTFGGALISSIRRLSLISGKKGTLEFASNVSDVASSLRDSAEIVGSNESVDSAAAFFQLVADLAGKGNFAVAVGNAFFQGGNNEFDTYAISASCRTIDPNASESQLKGLKVYTDQLQQDVQALQGAQGQLAKCKQGPSQCFQAFPAIGACAGQAAACTSACTPDVSLSDHHWEACMQACGARENACVVAAKQAHSYP